MSPRTKEAYGRQREERIAEILQAAGKVFAAKGYSATMIEDVTVKAGISKGLIYHYFRSKDDLFEALVRQEMEGALKLIETALARPGTPWERLFWLVNEILIRTRQEPESYLIIMRAYVSEVAPPGAREMAVQYTLASARAIRELIVEGQSAGEVVDSDPDRLAGTFTACLQGLALSVAIGTEPVAEAPSADVILRMLKA